MFSVLNSALMKDNELYCKNMNISLVHYYNSQCRNNASGYRLSVKQLKIFFTGAKTNISSLNLTLALFSVKSY